MGKPQLIDLPERNAIELFAPERAGPAESHEFTAEPVDDFAAEVLIEPIEPIRSAVPIESRSRTHAATVLASIGLIALVAVWFVMWRSGGSQSLPAAPNEPPVVIAESRPEIPALPPVSEVTPPPVAEAPAQPTPEIPIKDPPRAREPGALTTTPRPDTTPRPTARLERPLSQDPGRLIDAAPSPPRASVETPANAPITPPPTPSPSATVSPPVTAPASGPTSAPLSAAVAPPAAAPPTPTAPAPAAPSAPAASSANASTSAIESNTSGIRNTLARYQKAFSELDASAAREVWPTVNARTLDRAFERLEEQQISFEGCQIDVNDTRAEATCHGTARYVPRIGDRTARVDRRQWRFSLVKLREEWLIGAVEAK